MHTWFSASLSHTMKQHNMMLFCGRFLPLYYKGYQNNVHFCINKVSYLAQTKLAQMKFEDFEVLFLYVCRLREWLWLNNMNNSNNNNHNNDTRFTIKKKQNMN